MESRPTTAIILTLVGGLFILLGAIVGFFYLPLGYIMPGFFAPFLGVAALGGAIVAVSAVLLYYQPGEHAAWGVISIVFSVVSGVGVVTGYFALFGVAGMVLGLVGGSLAVAWKTVSWGPQPNVGAVRMCTGCGRYIPVAYPYCAFCGTPAPMFRPPGGAVPPQPGMPPHS